MFVARYDNYVFSLLADEALQWRRAFTAGRREDKLIGLELTLDTGKMLQSMPKRRLLFHVRRPLCHPHDLLLCRRGLAVEVCTHCRQQGGQVDQHGAHVGHWQEAAVHADADHQ